MNYNIQLIEQKEVLGRDFRIYGDYENPLFLAKDIAEMLGLSNVTDMIKRVDIDEVTKLNLGGLQGDCNFLTENGLYEVLMQSRKPIAKEFKRQVKIILKDIRRHGLYAADELLNNPDFLLKAALALKEARDKVRSLENEVEELKPKSLYCDMILDCKDLVSTTQIAKDYGRSAQWLNKYLNKIGIQYKRSNMWVLYDEYAKQGLASSKTHLVTDSDGNEHARVHTYWTQAGRLYIYQRLKEDGILPLVESRVEV
ncbi:MAG TPA: phage antirepressor KilAC domain-containing protein [Ruminococcus sp.]|nr:phage antirepressor KilAC domain-containing protein [Ruminococcus sp.]